MILDGPSHTSTADGAHATLDDLFRRALERTPDALALTDPPDRTDFTDGAPRRLTYAQADRAITALAARLCGFGLATDSVVALQLPNTVESVIALLGVLRAGLIAAPLPLLWRQADAAAALGRIGARALISSRRVGEVDFAELAMQVAAETFAVRFVCAFGDAPDGVVPLDDVFTDAAASPLPVLERTAAAADHVAVVTFDVGSDGMVPVARSHAELIAGGLAVQLEARIESGADILGTLALGSLAGLATTLVPWLMTGGMLALHQPFSPEIFARQCDACGIAVLPGALATRLAEAGLTEGIKAIIAVWRAPERLAASAPWPGTAALIDVAVFGEVGLIAMRRGATGSPSGLPAGRTALPRDATEPSFVLDVARSASGTLTLAGSMVSRAAFPPGAERGDAPRLPATDGVVDTGYACRLDRATNTLAIDGPPAGFVSVGGYRFLLRTLQDLVGEIEAGGMLAALPDMLAGHRLAGGGTDRDVIRETLIAQGVNPLLVAAFRARAARASAA